MIRGIKKMKTHRMSAIIVGVLYIIGTVSGILSVVVTRDLLTGEVYLTKVAANTTLLNLGAFFVLLMGLSLAAMPVFLYPIFKKKNEALALGMVVFRGPLEGSTYILFALNWLILGAFSQKVSAVGGETVSLQVIGDVFLQANNLIMPIVSITFIVGATLLYILFFQTELIPRWLSMWGFIGASLYVIVALFKFFGANYNLDLLYAPLGVQEMVMALWLIVKGFDQTALENLMGEIIL